MSTHKSRINRYGHAASARARILLVFAAALALAAVPAAAQQPPAFADIPEWMTVEYDCVTGDHYSDNRVCDGRPGYPSLPGGYCDQPDVLSLVVDGFEVQQRCDDHSADFYERPFSEGGPFYPDDDLVYVLATEDDTWWYFMLQVYGLRDGQKLDANYAVEMDYDPDNISDYRPQPGQDPDEMWNEKGASCSDWFFTVFSPTANILEKVGWDTWGEEGTIAFFDGDNDMGGCHCGERDDPDVYPWCDDIWSGSGAEILVDDQQSGGTHHDGLWAMMPSDCNSIATSYIDEETMKLYGLPDGFNYVNGSCVLLAVNKGMVGDYHPSGTAPDDVLWRAWTNKGEQDNANVHLHDKYNLEQSGVAYRDHWAIDELGLPFGVKSAKELDSSARMGAFHGFQKCPVVDQVATELLVFGEYQSFSSGVFPAAAGETPDSVFLSNFVPLEDSSRWPSNLYHFIRPLPLIEDADGNLQPDTSETCADADDTGCLVWNARTKLVQQAPTPDSVATSRKIGPQPTERRVLYPTADESVVPRAMRLFDYPADADEFDLWFGLGIPFLPGDTNSEDNARLQAEQVIRDTLQTQEVVVGGETLTFVAGDTFHSDIHLVEPPTRFHYLANDLEGNGKLCTDKTDINRGYACFFQKHRRRRRVLLAPSNDGQVHAYDAGRYSGSVTGGELVGEYDRGTGSEIFSLIPRAMLPHTTEMTITEHDFGIDLPVVTDDVFIDPAHAGTPTVAKREWRTVAIGGYREGARGYYALDLTQPDPLDEVIAKDFSSADTTLFVPEDRGANYVPECTDQFDKTVCGPNPYPSVLWEFSDDCLDGLNNVIPCDEDGNGFADLGPSWSKANTGRVKVLVNGVEEIRYVAIFGGGLGPDDDDRAEIGNFLFMVDIETGKTLHKMQLDGPVPSEPAAVDTNQNTLLDTVYVGTWTGTMYKLDLSTPPTIDAATGRVAITDPPQWVPFEIFDTGGRPIFFPPEVISVASLGHYALAFGTGDRSDIFSNQAAGRFYMIVDSGFGPADASLPFTEADLEPIALDAQALAANLLTSPTGANQAGWVLSLDDQERVVNNALALSGLLAFPTFVPDQNADVCGNTLAGDGRVYSLLATNANGLRTSGTRSRFVEGFAADLFVAPPGEGATTQSASGDPFDTQEMFNIRENLKSLFPPNCKFGNDSMQVWAMLSNTSQQAVADVPICVITKNWREF